MDGYDDVQHLTAPVIEKDMDDLRHPDRLDVASDRTED